MHAQAGDSPIGCAAIGSAAGIAGLTVLVEAVQQSRRSSSFPVAQPAERPAVQRSALTYADQVPLRRRHRRQLRRSQRAGSVGRVAVAEGGYGVHPGAFEALLDGQESSCFQAAAAQVRRQYRSTRCVGSPVHQGASAPAQHGTATTPRAPHMPESVAAGGLLGRVGYRGAHAHQRQATKWRTTREE